MSGLVAVQVRLISEAPLHGPCEIIWSVNVIAGLAGHPVADPNEAVAIPVTLGEVEELGHPVKSAGQLIVGVA